MVDIMVTILDESEETLRLIDKVLTQMAPSKRVRLACTALSPSVLKSVPLRLRAGTVKVGIRTGSTRCKSRRMCSGHFMCVCFLGLWPQRQHPAPSLNPPVNPLPSAIRAQETAAYKLAEQVVRRSTEHLQHAMPRLFATALGPARGESQSQAVSTRGTYDCEKMYHEIILEVYRAAPDALSVVIPRLQAELLVRPCFHRTPSPLRRAHC